MPGLDKKEQQTKQKTIKELGALKAAPKCPKCGKYAKHATANLNPRCQCDGKDQGNDEEKSASAEGKSGAKSSEQAASAAISAEVQAITGQAPAPQLKTNGKLFDAEIISEMLANNILVIDNNKNTSILTIKFRYDPKLLPAEQRQALTNFLSALLNELEEFKKEKGITSPCKKFEKDKLLIMLPPSLYLEFINRLAKKQLLPKQVIDQKPNEKISYQKGINHFTGTPFATKPTPAAKKKLDLHKSIRPKSIVDGLKRW